MDILASENTAYLSYLSSTIGILRMAFWAISIFLEFRKEDVEAYGVWFFTIKLSFL